MSYGKALKLVSGGSLRFFSTWGIGFTVMIMVTMKKTVYITSDGSVNKNIVLDLSEVFFFFILILHAFPTPGKGPDPQG